MKPKKPAKRAAVSNSATVGERIIEGLQEAIAWSKGDDVPLRASHVQVPEIDVSKVRRRMGLSQTQFALKFGFPPAAAELGAGKSPPRHAHARPAGGDREISRERRGRLK
jgi:hypothetical protein